MNSEKEKNSFLFVFGGKHFEEKKGEIVETLPFLLQQRVF
tara:strand:- start:204 stop:323 length:120 start_codon:yes stop_codon:yes gene_type:complete